LPEGRSIPFRVAGGLLLELYSRDGIGTMISTDFYEGIRRATPGDVPAIKVCASDVCDVGPSHRQGTQHQHEALRRAMLCHAYVSASKVCNTCAAEEHLWHLRRSYW
jgi:hypothetical protein